MIPPISAKTALLGKSFPSSPALFELVKHLSAQDVKFKFKSDFWPWQLLSKFKPDFNTTIVTTIGNTIWIPDGGPRPFLKNFNNSEIFEVLAHEYVHICDSRRHNLFALRYLFPQILSVLSLVSIFAFIDLWFLFSLVFLLALAPLPSPRLKWEIRGYTMSLAVQMWLTGRVDISQFLGFVDSLTSSTYYTGYKKDTIKRRLNATLESIDHLVSTDKPFIEIYTILRKHDEIKEEKIHE